MARWDAKQKTASLHRRRRRKESAPRLCGLVVYTLLSSIYDRGNYCPTPEKNSTAPVSRTRLKAASLQILPSRADKSAAHGHEPPSRPTVVQNKKRSVFGRQLLISTGRSRLVEVRGDSGSADTFRQNAWPLLQDTVDGRSPYSPSSF